MRSYHRNPSPASVSILTPRDKILQKSTYVDTSSFNPQQQPQTKLPSINSFRRSGSLSAIDRNSKFKLQNIEDKLSELKEQVLNTRLESQQTINHIRFLKQSLIDTQLNVKKQDLKKQIKGLERLVNCTIQNDCDRFNNLKNDCNDLWNQTENLRQMIFEIRMRTQELDATMGYK